MKSLKSFIILVLILIFSHSSYSQTNTCSGSYVGNSNSCQTFIVGNGTPGTIQICLTSNNIGTSNCNPGGACNPPFNGGGWTPRVAVYNSNGATYSGAAIGNFFSSSPTGTCITVTSITGYASIFGICMGNGTSISWTTIDACGQNACDPATPPCVIPCSSCSNACGSCGFPAGSTPTVAEVTANCTSYAFNPPLLTGQTATRCHQFVADGTTADFRIALTAACGVGGNVTNFSWTLQQASCGAVLSSGTTVAPTLTGLTPGTTYTYCYTFTVSSNCTSHTAHYPYFIGTITVLPIELGTYRAYNSNTNTNKIEWTTESERDNEYFSLEHSTDGLNWKQLVKYPGAGNSSIATSYSISHKDVESTFNYYRLSQTDFDGTTKTFHPLLVDNTQSTSIVKTVNIYGQEVPDTYKGLVIEYFSDGSTIKRIR